ncbi:MAG: PepSY domain-containing protein, partial [Sphingobium sp.]|nr:PepSY domain-containing protein [Sphingobium sp.]
MNTSLRQSMASLHTWAGLLPGWLLYVVFLFGTIAFFQQEISAWMRPELQTGSVSNATLDRIVQRLSETAPDSKNWRVSLPDERGGDPITASWESPTGVSEERNFDPVIGRELIIRATEGGYFLYRFHFDLHYMPSMWARMLISIATLAMLVAILSGVITHKKIFADFFMLRFGKGQRSWLDAHNITAVLALPFHVMITYTGLVTLLFTLMPWPLDTVFPNRSEYYKAAFPAAPKPQVFGASDMLAPSTLVARAGYTPNDIRAITLHNWGKAGGIAAIWPRGNRIGGTHLATYLDAETGNVVQAPPHHGPAFTTQNVMIDLHAGRFSAPVLRWLYFLSGVGGTVMVASGLVLWTVKRRAKLPDPARPYLGFRLVERLNIGVIVG